MRPTGSQTSSPCATRASVAPPRCDAPVRHVDHIVPVAEGGETSEHNTQGLCQACNHAKQAAGWAQRVVDGGRAGPRHTVETITPTGHRHRSQAPAPPTPARDRPRVRLTHEPYSPAFDIRYVLTA